MMNLAYRSTMCPSRHFLPVSGKLTSVHMRRSPCGVPEIAQLVSLAVSSALLSTDVLFVYLPSAAG